VIFIFRNEIMYHERFSPLIFFGYQIFGGYALFISNTTFGYISFRKIQKFTRLKELSIHTGDLSNKDIINLNSLPLEKLALKSCYNIDYKMFLFLPKTLTHLTLTHTTISDEAVKRLPSHIQHLSLGWVGGLTKEGLFQLSQKVASIQMNDCFKIAYEDSDDFSHQRPGVYVRHMNLEPY